MNIKPILTAAEAAELIQDGWTITTGGFGSCGHPDMLSRALEKRFLRSGRPRDLTLVFAAGQGDRNARGLNQLAHRDLLRRVIGGYWALTPRLAELVMQGEIQGYNFPQGVVSHLYRAIAAGAPGVFTTVGLNTFVDPRIDGGKLGANCAEDLVELVRIRDRECLLYPSFPIHCALLRGSRADAHGNITMEWEANLQDNLAQAQAVRNSGGVVIVQVLEIVRGANLPLHQIRIPGVFVDYLVQSSPVDHWQTYAEQLNSGYIETGVAVPTSCAVASDAKAIVALRAYSEVAAQRASVINLGIGTPERIVHCAAADPDNRAVLTIESGVIGGTPAGGLSFGASHHPHALLDQPSQFDFYDGGGVDLAFLGFGQIDRCGNVNVSRLPGKLNGAGGFINISQGAKSIVFCGQFTARGSEVCVSCGKLRILREGSEKKFVSAVDHLTFSARHGTRRAKSILYITERGVFRLIDGRLHLTEVAPGVDIERDIQRLSAADIIVPANVEIMNTALFQGETDSRIAL